MNVFYEDLPNAVEIRGEEYRIITDFREWIRFSDMIKADIPVEIKVEFIAEMFLDNAPEMSSKEGMEDILDAFMTFLSMESLQIKSKSVSGKQPKENISYEYDAPCIISAFLRDYRLDLLEIPYLHWWKFKMLLEGLDERNQIKEILHYRGVDLSEISDKEERKRIQQIKRKIELPEAYVSDGDIGNAFV